MLPHSKLDLCAPLTLSISVLQDTKPPAARQKHRLRGETWRFNTARLSEEKKKKGKCVSGLGPLRWHLAFVAKSMWTPEHEDMR